MSKNKDSNKTKNINNLPMFKSKNLQSLEKERAYLKELKSRPFYKRWTGYAKLTGPGWLQSAMTLGGASAASSLFIGATYGYKLLWVQPLAMLLALIMFITASNQTLFTGMKPFDAVSTFIHPAAAWLWAVAALLSTFIWHFPQYALAAGVIEDILSVTTPYSTPNPIQTPILVLIGFILLIISAIIVMNYSSGPKGIHRFERSLKMLIWLILISFSIVVLRAAFLNNINWKELISGFIPFNIPTDKRSITLIMGAFGSAAGINMTFIFGYSQIARGWTKEHRSLAKFDLVTGMFLPYVIATSLMVISAALTIYSPGNNITTSISPLLASKMIAAAGMGEFFGRIIFGLGILAMTLSTIIMHMLVCGFVISEIFKFKPYGVGYKFACMIPAPAFIGVITWKYMGYWVAVPTSAIAGIFLPIAYIYWFILNNKKDFMKEDMPSGIKRILTNSLMFVAISISLISISFYLYSNKDFFLL
ncbi:MAG: divalent metal cation transporter [Candidatus Omnitrophica bacterium]|nr:divalent metal cation transporter [Candidatus Omnitrophota bacterium]MDD5081619.1 divalent metal cation transporter [Candidatus Omnitrophota bacterium]